MPSSKISSENHELLVQLSTKIGEHITEQKEENMRVHKRIEDVHQRIDTVQEGFRKGIDEIKDSLAQRGRVTSSHVFGLIGALGIILGMAHAYVDVRLGNVTPLIERNALNVSALDAAVERQREQLTLARIESATHHASAAEALRWLEKRADTDTDTHSAATPAR